LASSSNVLYAIHLPDFKPLWHFQAQGFGLMPVAVDGNRLAWVTGGSGDQAHLNLLDLQSGRLIWEVSLDGVPVPGNAMIRAGIIYVNSPISAFQLDSGQKVWQAAAANSLGIGQAVLSPDGQTLYSQLTDSSSLQNRIAAISTQDGSLRWLTGLGTDNLSLIGTLALDGGVLVIPLNSGTRSILALDAATGKELWRYTPDQPRLGNPTIHQGKAWFTLQNGQIVVVDIATGHEIARLGLTQAYLESYDFTQSIAFSGGYALASAGWSLLEVKLPAGWQP
jgi:outer membrane protein assembly factor BamB